MGNRSQILNKAAAVFLFFLIVSLVGNIHLIYRAMDYRRGANEWLEKYTKVIDEYSRTSAYSDENAALKSDTLVDNRIIFFGSQVIQRWDLQKYFPGYETIARGITGQWVSGLLLRYYGDVIELKPEIVLIEISSYNLRPQFSLNDIQSQVAAMAELARYHGITPVLSTMIPVRAGYDKYDKYSVAENLIKYNAWLKTYCKANGFRFIDLYEILSDEKGFLKAELSNGPIDPDENGYKLMSEALIDILKEFN